MRSLLEEMRESYNKGRNKGRIHAKGVFKDEYFEEEDSDEVYKVKVKPLEKKKKKKEKNRFYRGKSLGGKYKGIF